MFWPNDIINNYMRSDESPTFLPHFVELICPSQTYALEIACVAHTMTNTVYTTYTEHETDTPAHTGIIYCITWTHCWTSNSNLQCSPCKVHYIQPFTFPHSLYSFQSASHHVDRLQFWLYKRSLGQ